jgi:NADH-quinone oxidoreductase subunit E
MAKKKTKSTFIGIKVTGEQAETLARLQEVLKSATKTGVLLEGLYLLAKSHSLPPAPMPAGPDFQSGSQIATSLELSQFEAEARRYIGILQQTKSKSEEVMKQMIQELAQIDKTVDKYGCDKSALIQILLDIQRENRWLPKEALMWVSQKLDIPLARIYHIATFYKAFSLVPQGRHSVAVCMGTACHVRGAPRLLDKVVETLKIEPGETSKDMRFTLNTVNCLGCCALGPVMLVDEEYHSNPSTEKMEQIFAACD